jgi:hypothetical protein
MMKKEDEKRRTRTRTSRRQRKDSPLDSPVHRWRMRRKYEEKIRDRWQKGKDERKPTCYALTLCLAKETRDKSSARREEETKMARK